MDYPTAPTIDPQASYKVYTKAAWGDAWVVAPYWFPVQVYLTVAPHLPSAKLRFHFGKTKQEDQTAFTQKTPPVSASRFVKITVKIGTAAEAPLFVGYAPSEEYRAGADAPAGPTGDYEATAYGLEYLLDNLTVDGHFVDPNGLAGASPGSDAVKLRQPGIFNDKECWGGAHTPGNRGTAKLGSTRASGNDSYVFDFPAYDPENPPDHYDPTRQWTALNIAEYLLLRFGATASNTGIEFELGGQWSALDQIVPPRFDATGMTVRAALNHLIDRRRGLGWTIRHGAADTDPMQVWVFSVLDTANTTLGVTLPSNGELKTVNLNSNLRIGEAVVVRDWNTAYGAVEVHGAPIRVVFSVDATATGDLVPGWTAADQTAYNAATDDSRGKEKYDAVYRRFVLKKTFDWKAKASAACSDSGVVNASGSTPMRQWGRLLSRKLALLNADKSQQDPLVVIEAPPSSGKYVAVHRLAGIGYSPGHVQMLDDAPGLQVNPHVNHAYAKGVFTAASAAFPELDYRTLRATVCVATDEPVRVRQAITGGNPDRVLTVRLHHAECWVIKDGTVLDVNDDGTLQKQSGNAILRNDAGRLMQVAAFAVAWYSKPRSALSFGWTGVNMEVLPGMLITSAAFAGATAPINSVLTSVSYNLGEKPTTYFSTSWEALDFEAIGGMA